jgi:hypothetical protein
MSLVGNLNELAIVEFGRDLVNVLGQNRELFVGSSQPRVRVAYILSTLVTILTK